MCREHTRPSCLAYAALSAQKPRFEFKSLRLWKCVDAMVYAEEPPCPPCSLPPQLPPPTAVCILQCLRPASIYTPPTASPGHPRVSDAHSQGRGLRSLGRGGMPSAPWCLERWERAPGRHLHNARGRLQLEGGQSRAGLAKAWHLQQILCFPRPCHRDREKLKEYSETGLLNTQPPVPCVKVSPAC